MIKSMTIIAGRQSNGVGGTKECVYKVQVKLEKGCEDDKVQVRAFFENVGLSKLASAFSKGNRNIVGWGTLSALTRACKKEGIIMKMMVPLPIHVELPAVDGTFPGERGYIKKGWGTTLKTDVKLKLKKELQTRMQSGELRQKTA